MKVKTKTAKTKKANCISVAKAEKFVSAPSGSTSESSPGESPGIITYGPNGQLGLRPFPHDLLLEAEQEPDRIELADYYDVIVRLRQKGFTYREIAEWFVKRGVDADHNAVYRVHQNNMTDEEKVDEAIREQDEKILE